MKILSLLRCILMGLMFAGGAHAQKPAIPPAPPATSPEVQPDKYIPLTPDRKAAVRDLQYHIDNAEVRASQLQLEIDEVTIRNLRQMNTLRQQQAEWNADISVIATDFAQVMKVDRSLWELDQVNLRLAKKAAAIAPEKKPAGAK